MKRPLSLFLVLTLILCFTGCRKQSNDTVSTQENTSAASQINNFGDRILIGSVSEPLNLIPLLATDDASKAVTSLLYNGLVKQDAFLNTVGDLAESWDISADGTGLTFHLRTDVYWHDGVQFTAEDVLFTCSFILSAGSPIPYDADEFGKIKAISALDKYTVMIEYDNVTTPILLSWSVPMMPKHLLEEVAITKSPLQKAPVGTGPYIFDSWNFGDSLTLRANDAYFAGRPSIAALEFRYYDDQESAYNDLISGGQILDVLSVTPSEFNGYTGTQFNKFSFPNPAYSSIGYNFSRRPFNEPVVREALSLAVDRTAILDTALSGYGRLTDSPYLPDSYWYNSQLTNTPYDPVQAATLLDEAGWKLNKNGIRAKGTQVLRVTLITNKNPLRIQIAELIRDNWLALGVQVELKTQTWGEFLGDLGQGNFDAALMEMSITQDPDLTDIWHSSRCLQPNALNFGCFKSDKADSLLESGAALTTAAERKIYYDQLQQVLAQERPGLFLYVADTLVLVSSRVKGVHPSSLGVMQNITDWYVPTGEHKYDQIQ